LTSVRIEDVRSFWERNPVSASAIPHPLGTAEYFQAYDRLRERNESVAFSEALHEYGAFAGKRVLDVGAGNGYVLARYARSGGQAFGVDLTSTAVDLCRRRFALERLEGRFAIGSAECLPFASGTFDCVCSMGVLHHTPDVSRAMRELRRVLRPGGRLIVMVYHRNSALYRLKFASLRLLSGKSVGQLVNEVDGEGNPKGDVFSKRQLWALLEGFSDVELSVGLLQGWMCLPRGGGYIPDSWVRPLAGWLGWFLYAKARRA
jgi:SAM-dependent methyltransferase